jgi:hypothetical protein
MADYGAFPLWAVPDDGSVSADDVWVGMLAPDELPLSASLVAELQGWAGKVVRFHGAVTAEHSAPIGLAIRPQALFDDAADMAVDATYAGLPMAEPFGLGDFRGRRPR